MLTHSAVLRFGVLCCVILARTFIGTSCFAQVTADFNATLQSGCSPLTVQFFHTTTGPVTSYFWDFGNGNTSTLSNPGVIYVNPGTYTVSLTVSDGVSSDTEIKTGFVTVFADPIANLIGTPPSGCAPLSVTFTDQSQIGDAPINGWTWDFGDGNISPQSNPTHLYATAGNFDLTLVVTDTNGCNASISLPNYINSSNPLNASFSSSAVNPCLLPHSYSFTSSVTPGGSYAYNWDFGDGNSATLANPIHTFATPGLYPVTLVVSSLSGGCPDTVMQNLAVQLQTPNANFGTTDTLACVGQALPFFNLSSGATNYVWDFGDGTVATGPSPVHAYLNPGTYTVSLIAFSAGACSDTLVRSAYVSVQASPMAAFSSTDPTDCQAPLIVDFTNASTGALNYSWNFGDGSTANAPSPTHVYTAAGLYDVQLIVSNNFGCRDTLLQPNYVQIVPPLANFIADTISGCIPLKVDFLDLSSSVFDTVDTWIWNFGDGANSFLQNPTHTYTVPGQYSVSLIVQTTSGCQDTAVFNFIEAGLLPVIDFTANPLIVCAEDAVTFQDQSSIGTNFIWEFGDGATGYGPNPVHFYGDTGRFDVSLIVGHYGCYDTLIKPDFIRVLGPIAEFVMTPAVGCEAPLSVAFFDQSTDPQRWYWDFGDGSSDSVQNPSHVFTNAGTYTVTLVVTNDSTGCVSDYSLDLDIIPPLASFSANQVNGCTGTPVSFTNSSLNTDTWFWDFGDGNTSTAQNPSHVYASPGNFSVTLIASNAGGCADTLISPALVNIVGPIAQFQADTTTGCAPLAIQFNDLSTPTPSGTFITGWQWDFGDGGSSFSQNPIYTYNTPGSYDVTLTVVDNQGCADSVRFLNYINPTFPSAAFFTADTISCPGALVTFNNLSTGIGNSYLWDFGDGTTSSAVNPVHVYPPNGTFTVSLTATDVNGCVSGTIQQNLISMGLPTAAFFANPTQQACPPLTVSFTDQSSPQVTSWFWDFGDGSTSTLPNPGKVYSIPGKYDVSLIVSTTQGCTDTLFQADLINLSGPTGGFSLGPISGCNPHTVTFTANTDSAISWTWDFGDGSLGFGQTTTHTYTQDTIAYPVLLIQDTAGCTVAIPAPDSIVSLPGPNPAFMMNQTNLCLGESVSFTNASTSMAPIVSYQWYFGDGSASVQQNPLHVYTTPGVYIPKLITTNADGCVDSLIAPVPITISVPPDANFTPSVPSGCVPLQVSFVDSSIAGSGLLRFWDFGDGATATTQVPLHTYTTPGSYTVKLLITDGNGCQDSAFQVINVYGGPIVDFNAAPTTGCAPKNVQFASLATGSAFLTSWFWDFGDGGSSTQQNPLHTYLNDGQYSVSLTVTDVHGCSNTSLQPNLIDLTRPVAAFNSNSAPGCPDQLVNFTPNITSTHPIANWYWDFGDGDTAAIASPSHLYTQPGTYDVSLIIVDALGCSDTLLDPQHVTVYEPPVADFQADPSICVPGLLAATNQSSSNSIPITTYLWDFGNGTTASTANVSVNYATPGSYTLSLVVSNALGCADTATQAITVFPGITANFNVLNAIGCANTAVTFVDQSSGTNLPVSWQWDFGDGTGSSQQYPVHTYSSSGLYTVSLAVEDVNGCRDTVTQNNAINLNGPLAQFSTSTTQSCPGATVSFTDASVPDTTLVSWLWNFGDGTTSTQPSPVHSYANPGSYTVSLTITNAIGCADSEVKNALINVINRPTAAIAMSDSIGCAPLNVQFTDNSTSATNITGWNWDFGIGSPSIFPAATRVFSSTGVYNIRLVVTDANGCTDTTSRPLVVTDGPQVDFLASDTTGCASKVVSFVDLSTATSNLSSWSWDFGDGTSSLQQSPVHTYTTNGSYTVQLVVSDASGCVDSLTKPQYIILQQPQPDFSLISGLGCPGSSFGFLDLSVADTTITSWLWNFGDGTTGSGPNPFHTYSDTGFYSVTLTITDLFGCTQSLTKIDTVEVLPTPNAQFLTPNPADCSPLLAQFFDASQPANGSPIVSWNWNLGNGNSSTFPNATSTFTTPGFYPVSLTVTDGNGCTDSFADTVQVYFPPQTNFLASQQILCVGDTVNFVDVSTGVANVVSWFWNFGDGTQSNLKNPVHSYNQVGTYTVRLISLDANGCADTLLRPNYITVTQPAADFTLDQDADCPGLTVSFQDVSLADTTLTGWFWDFGDGTTSNLLQPTHVYTIPGKYTVSLTVTNLLGCQDTESKVDTVEVYQPPTPDFTPSDTAGCAPISVFFLNASSGTVPVQTWNWSFGDGTTSTSVNPSHNFSTPGLYPVKLRISDANGCVDSTTQTIEVYPLPQASFTVSDTVGCAPEVMLFTDLSFPAPVSWEWNFGDGSSSTLQNPIHTYANTGSYTVSLKIIDAKGCEDSLIRPQYIVLSQPSGDFTVDYVQDCPPLEATFQAAGTSPYGIATYRWDFGDGNSGTGTPVVHTYQDTGSYTVRLFVTDSLGCSDTIVKPDLVQVFGVDLPGSPEIQYVTVENDAEVRLVWSADRTAGFDRYVVYRETPSGSNNWMQIHVSPNELDTTLVDLGLEVGGLDCRNESYCYRVTTVNYCGSETPLNLADEHCTIEATAQALPDQIAVNWNPYVGWDVDVYEVYRVSNYDPGQATFLATVPGFRTNYLDTMTNCFNRYTYRVAALGYGMFEVSWSDTTQAENQKSGINEANELVRATVEDDRYVRVDWKPFYVKDLEGVFLEKSSDQGQNWATITQLNQNAVTYLDTAVKVYEQAYWYRLFARDSCGFTSAYTNLGTSIFLDLDTTGYDNHLQWTPYQAWAGGVDFYEVQLWNEATQQWVIRQIVDGATTEFKDVDVFLDQGKYCYRIVAYERGGNLAQSVSNEACLPVFPKLYAPTAFSPNYDDINERFYLQGLYVRTFSLRIYNRWGLELFSANNLNQGWDGTHDGVAVPEGVFVWVAEGTFNTGQPFVRKGTVTLLR